MALSLAAEHGHGDEAMLLLTRSDIDVNLKDRQGWTPLLYVTGTRYEMMKVFTERHDNNLREAVARPPVARVDTEADPKNNNGRTPLTFTAAYDSEEPVRLLLAGRC